MTRRQHWLYRLHNRVDRRLRETNERTEHNEECSQWDLSGRENDRRERTKSVGGRVEHNPSLRYTQPPDFPANRLIHLTQDLIWGGWVSPVPIEFASVMFFSSFLFLVRLPDRLIGIAYAAPLSGMSESFPRGDRHANAGLPHRLEALRHYQIKI